MSETDIKDQDGAGATSEPVQQAEAPSSGGANAAEPTGADTPPASEKKPVDPLAVAQADAARFRDQLLRTAADFDNYRKRSRREAEDAQKRGREIAIKELLPVFDNLERAAVHVESATNDAKSVSDGLRIVLKQFVDTLDKMGVKRVHAVGLPFDPSMHEAIQHMESKEPAGVIVAEVQAGYTLGDKLLRAAMVVVSKGPAETDAAAS